MSRKARSGKRAQQPPPGSTWIWHTLELLTSAAWRTRSIHCRRLIDFLEREHLHHGGVENASLIATYSQLEAEGIGRRFINGAIWEAEHRHLVAVERGDKKGAVLNELNRFRLTYLWHRTRQNGVYFWHEPTNDWQYFDQAAFNAKYSKRRADRKGRHKKIGAPSFTNSVHHSGLPTVHHSALPHAQAVESAKGGAVYEGELPSRFGGGTPLLHQAQRGAAHSEASASASVVANKIVDAPETWAFTTGQPLKSLDELNGELPSDFRVWQSEPSPDVDTALKRFGEARKSRLAA